MRANCSEAGNKRVPKGDQSEEGSDVRMSVKKLIFSAASSLLLLWFVVPLLGMDTMISVLGTATVLVVAVFSVSAAGLIAEGCIALINASNRKLPLLRPAITQEQPASESASDVSSALSDLTRRVKELEGNLATAVPVVAKSTSASSQQQTSRKQSNNNKSRVDVLLGAKEVVA